MRATRGTRGFFALGLGLAVVAAMAAGKAGAGAEDGSAMTTAETQETMEAYVEALLGGGAYESFFAEDVVVTMTGVPGEIRGRAEAKAAIDAAHREQFDARIEVVSLVVGEGQAAIEAVFVGTHTDEFAGIAPTGREVEVPYAVIYELADGQITALRAYAWAEGVVQQLQAVESGRVWAAPPRPSLPVQSY